MMTLGIPAFAWLRGAADGVVLELGSEITQQFTSRAMHAMENLTPAQVKMRNPGTPSFPGGMKIFLRGA
jgi:hypothetical protein